jgi:hypothetical protein
MSPEKKEEIYQKVVEAALRHQYKLMNDNFDAVFEKSNKQNISEKTFTNCMFIFSMQMLFRVYDIETACELIEESTKKFKEHEEGGKE